MDEKADETTEEWAVRWYHAQGRRRQPRLIHTAVRWETVWVCHASSPASGLVDIYEVPLANQKMKGVCG
jgi:hypothetical protein